MGQNESRQIVDLDHIDNEGVFILMYEWTPSNTNFINSVSKSSSKSLSDASRRVLDIKL